MPFPQPDGAHKDSHSVSDYLEPYGRSYFERCSLHHCLGKQGHGQMQCKALQLATLHDCHDVFSVLPSRNSCICTATPLVSRLDVRDYQGQPRHDNDRCSLRNLPRWDIAVGDYNAHHQDDQEDHHPDKDDYSPQLAGSSHSRLAHSKGLSREHPNG